jgi:death-on-curing protein
VSAVYRYPDEETAKVIIDDLGMLVRDAGALSSAIARPQAVVWGTEAYEGLHMKAAALMDAVNRSHPLFDGNKRLSFLLVWRLYDLNGYRLHPTDVVEADVFIRSVGGDHVPLEEIAKWLEDRVTER